MDLFRNLIYLGAILALLQAAMELLRPARSRRDRFFLINLCLASTISRTGWYLSGELVNFPWVSYLFNASVLMLGPLAYGKLLTMIESDGKGRGLSWLHFLPALLVAMGETVFQFAPAAMQTDLLTQTMSTGNFTIIDGGFIFVGVHADLYLLFTAKRIYGYSKQYSVSRTRVMYLMLGLPFAGAGLVTLGHFLPGNSLFIFGGLLMTTTVIAAFLLKARYPDFFDTLQGEIRRQRYERTQLDSINVDAVAVRLRELMEDEHLYKTARLSLDNLAEMLLVTRHQMSRILNEHYGQTFSQLVNSFRVDAAKKMLRDDPSLPVINIAYQVGFSTKANFNSQFQKIAGMTPQNYRRKFRPDSGVA